MTKQRQPELEEIELTEPSGSMESLNDQLGISSQSMHQSYTETQSSVSRDEDTLHILVVDDNQIFLDSLQEASADLNMQIYSLQPSDVKQTRDYILRAFKQQQQLDCVLLDFAYAGQNFNGLDILRTLRPPIEKVTQGKAAKDEVRLYYLPVAIVTRGGPGENQSEGFDPDEALGAGADKVYSEKGFGQGVIESTTEGFPTLTARPLLISLRRGGFKEMRFRAWARLWQDLRDKLEEQIKRSLDGNYWLTESRIEETLIDVWDTLAGPIIDSGYASHLSMRILHYRNKKDGWELQRIGSTDTGGGCPVKIPWDAIALFETCLSEETHGIHTLKALSNKDLINSQYKDFPELKPFKKLQGRVAMAARLDSKVSPVGTLLFTREKGQDFFSGEDKTHLRITVERLGLFYRELRLRHRHHKRQMALVRLGREIMDIDDENLIVAKAVKALHFYLHRLRGAFTPKHKSNPAFNGRVSIRLIESGTGRLMRPDQTTAPKEEKILRWALGFDTKECPPSIMTVYSDERYTALIEESSIKNKSKFHFVPNTQREQIEKARRDKTHAKMLLPIKAGSVVIGSVNVEHQQAEFYGKDSAASADWALLAGVALEVGQALRASRARKMLRNLLRLHKSTGEDNQLKVISNLMGILYHYTGCAVGLWIKPDGEHWKVNGAWECEQGYKKNALPAREFKNNHKKPSDRMAEWQQHLEEYFTGSFVGQTISEHTATKSSVYYSEETFPNSTKMGIDALSQAVLILCDSKAKETLGAFVFMFNQSPGLDMDRQEPLLIEAADFAASYLSIRKKNNNYLLNSQIMEQQVGLGLAYQQLRHSLKLQLGGVNGKLDRLLDKFKNEPQIQEIKGVLSNISQDIKISSAMMKTPNCRAVDLKVIWADISKQFEKLSVIEGSHIKPMSESVWVYADIDIVKMVFYNLIDNALEAMADRNDLREVSCFPMPELDRGDMRIAVRNTGASISGEIAAKLFEEIGVSTKPMGTGFGTYFSAYMLRRAGANIHYDQHYKKGAQFILRFPIVPAEDK